MSPSEPSFRVPDDGESTLSGAEPEEVVFEKAGLISDPAQRARYLDEACHGRPDTRRRLAEMLSLGGEAEAFFSEGTKAIQPLLERKEEGVPPVSLSEELFGEQIGKRIGRYKLVEKLGEGGWGAVYMAEQEEPVRRRVALKIIKLGMETRSVIARFEAERQALAMMDHPNIARVFDAGATDRGSPYFVMELVDGIRITEFCDQHLFGITQRLELFVQVCNAIQHAHQKGIIHRDIKPSNIMVAMQDGKPVIKVIDFGIAKATEARLTDNPASTAVLQLVGTPAYMSPEQAELRWMDVDTRSDIYSLGVILYELLTGCPPFDPKRLQSVSFDEMRRILREQEPPRPSVCLIAMPKDRLREVSHRRREQPARHIDLLQGDLDWIIMKTLEKSRTRRYETANALAMDIQRHLGFEPVLARPPSWHYRLEKLVRRNWILFASGTAVTLALIAGFGTSTVLFLRERAARQRAMIAEQQQARLRLEAELREQVTQATLLVNQDKFEAADHLLSSLQIDKPSQEAAAIYRALGEWHALNGRWDKAKQSFQRLLEVDSLDGWDNATLDILRAGPAILETGDEEAYLRFRERIMGQYSDSNCPGMDRVLKISLFAPPDAKTLRDLEAMAKETERKAHEALDAGDAFQAAWKQLSTALWEYRKGNYERSSEIARVVLSSSDYNPVRLCTVYTVLALSEQAQGRREDAEADLQRAIEIFESKFRNRSDRGSPVVGFWFDWAYARILMRECSQRLGGKAGVPPFANP